MIRIAQPLDHTNSQSDKPSPCNLFVQNTPSHDRNLAVLYSGPGRVNGDGLVGRRGGKTVDSGSNKLAVVRGPEGGSECNSAGDMMAESACVRAI